MARGRFQRLVLMMMVAALGLLTPALSSVHAAEKPIRIVAFGDSLMAGYGLAQNEGFPAQLERALKAEGLAVEVANAGVSGDTSSGGLSRLEWSVPDGTDAVILGLGANDMLRGIDPQITRKTLDTMVRRLKDRGIAVLLAGMRAPPNLGPDYQRAFDSIYPDLAKAHDVLIYPFFLDGIAVNAKLNQADGIHPTAEGVAEVVRRILPAAKELIARARDKRAS